MRDMKIFSTKAFHFGEFLNLAVDRIYSGSRPPWSSEKREKENGCLSSDNVRWKIFVRTQGASQVPNTVKTPLWFIFAKMLMSGESDSGFGNRIVPTVCKVYNVICVSDMKGRVLLEKNTREACKKPPVVCRRRLRGILLLHICQLQTCVGSFGGAFAVERRTNSLFEQCIF